MRAAFRLVASAVLIAAVLGALALLTQPLERETPAAIAPAPAGPPSETVAAPQPPSAERIAVLAPAVPDPAKDPAFALPAPAAPRPVALAPPLDTAPKTTPAPRGMTATPDAGATPATRAAAAPILGDAQRERRAEQESEAATAAATVMPADDAQSKASIESAKSEPAKGGARDETAAVKRGSSGAPIAANSLDDSGGVGIASNEAATVESAPAAAPAQDERNDVVAALPIPSAPADIDATPDADEPDGAPRPLDARAASLDGSSLKRFIDLYRQGDIEGGDNARAAITDPVARALLEWIAIRENGRALGFTRIVNFMLAQPDWPGAAFVRSRAEEALLDEKRPTATVRAFFASQAPASAAGKLALAMVLKADKKDEEAHALVRSAWRNDQIGTSLEAAIKDKFPGVIRQVDYRYRMERLLFKEQWQAALKAAAAAGPDYVALAKARIAVARKAGNAVATLDAVPPAVRSDTSYVFTRALLLMRNNKLDEAVKAIAGVSRDSDILVDGDEWWTERRILARKLLDKGEAQTAYDIVREHGASSDAMKIEAEFHAGWIALRFLGDPVTAARHFATAAPFAETPISRARVAYWQGRAAEAAHDPDAARAHYRRAAGQTITYYGQLARTKLDLDDLPLRVAPPGGRVALEKRKAVQAIPLLYEAGTRDLAMAIYLDLAKTLTDPAEIDALADIAARYKDARTMVLIGKAATHRGLPLDFAAFPTIGIPPYEPAGEPVEKPMVYAIARQESVFDPKAMSHAGARGLMQLMPATAKTTAKRAGFEFKPELLTSDASYNAKIGATHLRDLITEWRGSYILTFAAYNAGSGNVQKWIAAYGDPRRATVDPVDWVERIPFTETRNYVQRVMENLQVYRRRLGERTAVLIDRDLRRGSFTSRQ